MVKRTCYSFRGPIFGSLVPISGGSQLFVILSPEQSNALFWTLWVPLHMWCT